LIAHKARKRRKKENYERKLVPCAQNENTGGKEPKRSEDRGRKGKRTIVLISTRGPSYYSTLRVPGLIDHHLPILTMFYEKNSHPSAWKTNQPPRSLNKRIHAGLFAGLVIALWWLLIFSPFGRNLRSNVPSYSSNASKSPYAYVTLLAPNPKYDNVVIADDEDEYFVAVRVLAYQLLHAPNTGTNTSIPFVILATPDVKESKLERLRKDGATVKVIEKLSETWIKPGLDRWRDVLSKLRILELTEYEKVLCLDADMYITRRLDGIFTDPTTSPLETKPELAKEDEGPLPKSYMLSAQTYMEGRVHAYPPPPGSDYFGVGFFLCAPSIAMFNYYLNLAKIEDRFNSNAPEQGLLNYAHRRDGPMPWTEVYYQWTTTWPSMKEFKAGAASLHEKWWDESIGLDKDLRRLWYEAKGQMVGWHAARDQMEGDQ